MTDINTVHLTGRITRDLGERDFTYFSSGVAKAAFSIAVNAPVKKADGWGEKTSYLDIEVWGKQAEALRPHLAKGRQVTIEGSLEKDTWQDKQTGTRREKVYIKARNVLLARASGGQAVPQSAEFQDDWLENAPF